MDYPFYLSAVCILVALAGVIAALYARNEVSKESRYIRRAKNELFSSVAWEGAKVDKESELNDWLESRHLSKTSHVASIIRSAWLSWFLGRPASTTEFHANIARRERNRFSAKLASVIAGTLLVLGIVSTLLCVKGVLGEFEISVTDEGIFEDVADNAKEANDLIQNLSIAFLPSLWALLGTIAIVVSRGFYSSKMHQLIVDLDELSDSIILPQLRVTPLSMQFENIADKLFKIASTIEKRDENFAKAVESISTWSDRLVPSLEQFEIATKACTDAATKLGDNTQSLSHDLKDSLGPESTLVKAIENLSYSYDQARQLVDDAHNSLATIEASRQVSQNSLEALILKTERDLGKVPLEVEKQCKIAGHNTAIAIDNIFELREGNFSKSAEEAGIRLSTSIEPLVKEMKDTSTTIAKGQVDLQAKIEKAGQDTQTSVQTLINDTKAELREVSKYTEDQCRKAGQDTAETVERALRNGGDQMIKSAGAASKALSESLNPSVETIQRSVNSINDTSATIQNVILPMSSSLETSITNVQTLAKEMNMTAALIPNLKDRLEANIGNTAQSSKDLANSVLKLDDASIKLMSGFHEKSASEGKPLNENFGKASFITKFFKSRKNKK